MNNKDLTSKALNTWCPGCGNFAILNAIKQVLKSLIDEGLPYEQIVLVSGIGCHGKIVDYINVNSFNSLHGRAIPAAEGIKLGNPKLKVIAFAGDGDAYGEGLEHLIFAAKRNFDITTIIHNNRVYGLTTGQFSPTSPIGYKGKSTPYGSIENPLNPLELLLSSGATFVARAASHGIALLKTVLKEALFHKGFSLVDVLQVCVIFCNMYDYYSQRDYELEKHDASNYSSAFQKIREWDYNKDSKIPLGVFYKKEVCTFDSYYSQFDNVKIDLEKEINKVLQEMQ